MPTARPRVMVTLTPELSSTLDRVSAGTGQSKSALILDFLEGSHFALKMTAEALETVQKLQPKARAAFRSRVEQHERLALALVDAAAENLSLFAGIPMPELTDSPSVNKGGTSSTVRSNNDPSKSPKVVPIKSRKQPGRPKSEV